MARPSATKVSEIAAARATFAPMNSWCTHPPEELQRLFKGSQPLPGRWLCGLCGEIRFEPGEPSFTALAVGGRAMTPWGAERAAPG